MKLRRDYRGSIAALCCVISLSAAGAPASQSERIKALSELKSLLDSGAVTQAEFDQAKKGLLEGGA